MMCRGVETPRAVVRRLRASGVGDTMGLREAKALLIEISVFETVDNVDTDVVLVVSPPTARNVGAKKVTPGHGDMDTQITLILGV